jgi:hypothetical protein
MSMGRKLDAVKAGESLCSWAVAFLVLGYLGAIIGIWATVLGSSPFGLGPFGYAAAVLIVVQGHFWHVVLRALGRHIIASHYDPSTQWAIDDKG